MWPFKPRCPVGPEEQAWVEESLDWLVAEFGADPLHRAPVLPARAFFPADYAVDEASIAAVFDRVRERMGVPAGRIRLECEPDEIDPGLLANVPLAHQSEGAAGHWRRRGGRTIIAVRLDQAPPAGRVGGDAGHRRLTERMYGYALAYWAYLRGESKPAPWTQHLDTNPQVWMKQGLRYLRERSG